MHIFSYALFNQLDVCGKRAEYKNESNKNTQERLYI